MFSNIGFCPACNHWTVFIAKDNWWRDSYICLRCRSIPRERALMVCVEKFFPAWKDCVIHESSPCERGPSLRFRKEARQYIPSQYFPGQPPGSIIRGYVNEDLENLTFADNSIDLHISQDVFEHIVDPARAFREIERTLKPGGAHIFTTPLMRKLKPSQPCVQRAPDGHLIQLVEPPEYHGNPISEEGSLVTMHWGYDITRQIARACGMETEIVMIDLLHHGIRAELIEVLISKKK